MPVRPADSCGGQVHDIDEIQFAHVSDVTDVRSGAPGGSELFVTVGAPGSPDNRPPTTTHDEAMGSTDNPQPSTIGDVLCTREARDEFLRQYTRVLDFAFTIHDAAID